ncbi:hypothetical protein [Kordiimonas sp.]|uniref:hypothetical protein n=1 Tax=Kordiimonas sp. TaxID=1970157 RepID=UPI003A93B619
MRCWLYSALDAILKSPAKQGTIVDVPPYKFRYASRDLFSLGLLALFNVRPLKPPTTKLDFDYLFCDTVVKYFSFPGEGGKEAALFVSWIARSLFSIAEEDDFLDCTPADTICGELLDRTKRDPLFVQLKLTELSDFIPLFVSVLFAIHIQGLWPHLYERLDANRKPELVPPFKLMELFLNTWAEADLRFRSVTVDLLTEAIRPVQEHRALQPELQMQENWALYALRLAARPTEGPKEEKPFLSKKKSPLQALLRAAGRRERKKRHAAKGVNDEELKKHFA